MSENASGAETNTDAPAFETGRYLYCVVEADETDEFSETGIDGEPVSLVASDGVGAVVQPCGDAYDSDDLAAVREWLLTHQEVVDAAGEAFGTPLPFRFDTILKGDDDRVREWLADQRETLADYLDDFADHWEYRVSVTWDEERIREEIASGDEELADLRERIEDADEGTAFLLEKQYDQRLGERREARRRSLDERLRERLGPLVREFDDGEDEGGLLGDDSDSVVDVAFLAHEDDERAVGEALDEIAADPGVEVRFTGPWPPYSFAPELDA